MNFDDKLVTDLAFPREDVYLMSTNAYNSALERLDIKAEELNRMPLTYDESKANGIYVLRHATLYDGTLPENTTSIIEEGIVMPGTTIEHTIFGEKESLDIVGYLEGDIMNGKVRYDSHFAKTNGLFEADINHDKILSIVKYK